MSQLEEWTNQRLALFRKHVQEQKNMAIQEAQVRKELVAKHQAEVDHIRLKASALEWAHYVTAHVESLSDLAAANQRQRQAMRTRQETEFADLETCISRERESPPPYS